MDGISDRNGSYNGSGSGNLRKQQIQRIISKALSFNETENEDNLLFKKIDKIIKESEVIKEINTKFEP